MELTKEAIAAIAAAINADTSANPLPKAPTEPVLLGNIQVKKAKSEPWMSASVLVDGKFVEVTLPQEVVDALAASQDVQVGEPKKASDGLQTRRITGVRIKAQIGNIRIKDGYLRATFLEFKGLKHYEDAVIPPKFAF